MRKFLSYFVFSLAIVSPLHAQNVNGLYSGVAQTLSYIQQQYVYVPLPQATITVCYYPASFPAPGLPCTNLAQLYANATTATPAPSQFAADTQGNFFFWAPIGYYQFTITSVPGNVTTGPYSVVISPGSGGGGGGGAVFPFPGLVYATSNSAGTVATSSQIVAAVNNLPVTQFLPALLPTATTSSLGLVQPDGVSVTINSQGVISSVPPNVTIPATSFVLKGTGVANVATAAAPGTDYVIPSGSITGTSSNLSGTPTLPNGTAATTQTTGDNSSKIATDAFVLANSSGSPSFSTIAAGTNPNALLVSGTLGVTGPGKINSTSVNSNTFPASGGFTQGGIPYFSSTTAVSSSGGLTQYGVVLGGGASSSPTSTGADANPLHVLLAGSPPTFGAITASMVPTLNQNTTGTAANLLGCTPVPSVAGSVCIYNGSGWALLQGNNVGTSSLTENSSGVPSWSPVGTATIASGTAAMPTTLITSPNCSSAVTVTATGVVTTDRIIYTPNSDPTSTTGYAPSSTGSLYIWAYPTAGNVNFKLCNQTGASVTPGALALNWSVVR
jgi:hypothetical protein